MSNVQTPGRPARAEPLLELMVDADKRGQVDSRTPVRWCVGRPMLTAIEEEGFKNPYIVIVVRHRKEISDYGHGYRVWRDTAIHACPLTQELQYINFKAPGRNDIRAFVVEMNAQTAKWLRLARKGLNNEYDRDTLFREDGQLEGSTLRGETKFAYATYFDTNARVRVIVPAELFAPEPPQWRRNLINAYGMGKGPDQCGFRKRFWFAAVPLTLVGIPVWAYALKAIALLMYLFFGRLPNKGFWKTAANPLNLGGWMDALDGFSPSKWWHGKQAAVLGFINPPILLALPSAVWVIMHLPVHHYHVKGHSHHSAWYRMSWPHVALWVDGALISLVAAVALILVAILAIAAIVGFLISIFPNQTQMLVKLVVNPIEWVQRQWKHYTYKVSERRRERSRKEKLRLETELAAMTCRSESLVVDLAALPKSKQTVYLRFNDLKTKVCRPFAA